MVALATNLGVAMAKLVAAAINGSTALSAEASRAFADTGNQMLVLVAQRRSTRPGDERQSVRARGSRPFSGHCSRRW